jgi:hypothetical protein
MHYALDSLMIWVSMTTPSANLIVTNSPFTAAGTAADNVAVAAVYYNLNNTGWSEAATANAWANWTTLLTLVAGANTLQVYAVDTSGNDSTTETVSFVDAPETPIKRCSIFQTQLSRIHAEENRR